MAAAAAAMHSQPRARVVTSLLLLLVVFARLVAATDVHGMNPPVILSDDPSTPVTYTWPIDGAWPLSDYDDELAKAYAADEAYYHQAYGFDEDYYLEEDANAADGAYYWSPNEISQLGSHSLLGQWSPSGGPASADSEEVVVPSISVSHHRRLSGIDDVLEGVNDFFKGVGRNIRRKVLQAPAAAAPTPTPAATPKATPAAPPAAAAGTPAATQPTTPATTTPPATTTTTTTTPGTSTTTTTPTTTTTTISTRPTTGTTPTATTGTTTTTTTTSTTRPATPTSTTTTTPATATTDAEVTTEVTTKPAAKPDVAVDPLDIQPGEVVPAAVQQQQAAAKKAAEEAAAQATAGQAVQSSVPADVVSVAFRVLDLTPDQFSSWHLPTVLNTLAQLTGTPQDQWKATIAAKTTSTRTLMQAATTGNSYAAVSMSILTRNPQLVVYRLTQSPSGSAATPADSGCTSELCNRLVAAGVPVMPATVVISPDYSSVFQFGAPAVSAVDVKLAETQRMGAIIGASVGGGVLLILLLFTYKKIIACFKGQVASLTTRKQTKAAAAPSKATQQQQPELPRTTMDGSSSTKPPVAEFPVKFLSVSCSTGADMALTPAHNTHNSNNSAARVYKQGSSASQYSSSGGGIPVGPAVSSGPGDYHSSSNITPWAESDEVSPRDQQAHTVPPTAASLAVAAAASNQQGPLYHDSSSFRQWAAASAAAQSLGSSTPTNTPTSMTGSSSANGGKSFDGIRRPLSPATIANMAAAMPGSPISSPMYHNTPDVRHTSDGSSTHHQSSSAAVPPRNTPATVRSPFFTSASSVDVVQLREMLDAYTREQQQQQYQQHQQQQQRGSGVIMSMQSAAGGVGASGADAAGAAGSVSSRTHYPRRSSAPGTPTTTQPAGLAFSSLRATTTPTAAPTTKSSNTSEPFQLVFPWSARHQQH